MAFQSVQFLCYQCPTEVPSPVGVVVPSGGAPAVDSIRDPELRSRVQLLVNVLWWSMEKMAGKLAGERTLKVFCAPDALLRRFVPLVNVPERFDPDVGLANYPAGTEREVLAALLAALPERAGADWLFVPGSIVTDDPSTDDPTAALNHVPVLSVSGGRGSARVVSDSIRIPIGRPLSPQDVLSGVTAEVTRLGPTPTLEGFTPCGEIVVGVESSWAHQDGALRETMGPLSNALGRRPDVPVQLVVAQNAELSADRVVANVGGYAALADGAFPRDSCGRLLDGQPTAFRVVKVNGYQGPAGILSPVVTGTPVLLPSNAQISGPLPGLSTPQCVSLSGPLPLTGR